MNDKPVFSDEERRLLNAPVEPKPAAAKPRTTKKAEEPKASEPPEPTDTSEPAEKRGDLSPAQFDDDGWGDTPAQMRG